MKKLIITAILASFAFGTLAQAATVYPITPPTSWNTNSIAVVNLNTLQVTKTSTEAVNCVFLEYQQVQVPGAYGVERGMKVQLFVGATAISSPTLVHEGNNCVSITTPISNTAQVFVKTSFLGKVFGTTHNLWVTGLMVNQHSVPIAKAQLGSVYVANPIVTVPTLTRVIPNYPGYTLPLLSFNVEQATPSMNLAAFAFKANVPLTVGMQLWCDQGQVNANFGTDPSGNMVATLGSWNSPVGMKNCTIQSAPGQPAVTITAKYAVFRDNVSGKNVAVAVTGSQTSKLEPIAMP